MRVQFCNEDDGKKRKKTYLRNIVNQNKQQLILKIVPMDNWDLVSTYVQLVHYDWLL